MTFRPGSRALIALACGAALARGCTRSANIRAIIVDEQLVAAIQPGVDNKDSVTGTLGRPTFTGQFDREQRDWYYVSRQTRSCRLHAAAPARRRPCCTSASTRPATSQSVERTGARAGGERQSRLATRRRPWAVHAACSQELFGNIGAVGQRGQSGQTADNPG